MTIVAAVLLSVSAILFLWSYLVYPSLIAALARRVPPAPSVGPPPPSVEVLVSAADEEAVIGRRIENLLKLAGEAPDEYRVTIGCDGCRDATADAARAAGGDRARVLEYPERRGKAAVLNDLIAQSRADVIVFTDANTEFADGAVSQLLAPFADARVGAVCGRLVLQPAGNAGHTAETVYWDRETRVKEAEGRLGVCLGANGAIYAARRDRVEPLPEDTAMDDFLIPARIAHRGGRVVFAREAVAREPLPDRIGIERARRFRLGIGAGQVLRRAGWLLDASRHPLLTLAFLSRKAARWLAPVLALLGTLAAVASPPLRPFALCALLALALLLVLPEPRTLHGLWARLYYFCVMNVMLAAGVLAGLFGMSRPAWRRTPS